MLTVTGTNQSVVEWADKYLRSGNVINELQDEAVTPANPVDIVLSADDMTISGSSVQAGLLLTVTWTYTDAVLGAGAQRVVEYLLVVNNAVNK